MTKDKTKRPRGRPKTENHMSARLPVVQVTPTALESYKKSSDDAGLSFSAWVRQALDRASQ